MYSTHKEANFVTAERFIRALKNKIYKYMNSTSKTVYIDKLDDRVNECNNTYHGTIKIKPIDAENNTHINIDKEINDKDPKFRVDNDVKILRYQNIFAKCYNSKLSEEVL